MIKKLIEENNENIKRRNNAKIKRKSIKKSKEIIMSNNYGKLIKIIDD